MSGMNWDKINGYNKTFKQGTASSYSTDVAASLRKKQEKRALKKWIKKINKRAAK